MKQRLDTGETQRMCCFPFSVELKKGGVGGWGRYVALVKSRTKPATHFKGPDDGLRTQIKQRQESSFRP